MTAQTLRFWREVEPTFGPAALRFGNYRPLVKLRFSHPVQSTPGAVNLVFGEYIPPLFETIPATLAAVLPSTELPGLALVAEGAQFAPTPVVTATLAAVLPPAELPGLAMVALDTTPHITIAADVPAVDISYMTLTAEVAQHLDLPDADGVGTRMPSLARTPRATGALAVQQQHADPARIPAWLPHTAADSLGIGSSVRQQQSYKLARRVRLPHQHGLRRHGTVAPGHAESLRTRRRVTEQYQHGLPIETAARGAHAETIRIRHWLEQSHQHGLRTVSVAAVGHHNGLLVAARLHVGHQQMIPLPVGWWQATYPWPAQPGCTGSSPVTLRFCRLSDGTTRLVFGCPTLAPGLPPARAIIPILEYYIVINQFSLVRADNGQPIEVEDFGASLDVDSWCWGWSASLHADLMPLVRSPALGEHVELIATVNGTPLRLVVERIGRDRRFAESRLKISGRGRAAWLGDPHSPVITRFNAGALTAQQLLADALTENNVPIGWGIDWRLEDWAVPAGAWSHTGTYIDAARRIAEAGGGYVQAHDTAQTLILHPRYPLAPWAWAAATPDVQIPEDVCEVEGIEWHDKPAYNAVWISGQQSGRSDRIRRTGTAADRYAQSIVDPLATDPVMTRQRGLAVLADTGRQAHISLRLPVLPETGIIRPGQMVRYTEQGETHIGLTRAVSLQHQFPELWQTIRLETHDLEPI